MFGVTAQIGGDDGFAMARSCRMKNTIYEAAGDQRPGRTDASTFTQGANILDELSLNGPLLRR